MSNTYASFDPGKRTGVALWDEHGKCTFKGILLENELDLFLDGIRGTRTYKKFIIEEYRVYGGKLAAHAGSKVETIQVIGQIKSVARSLNVSIVEQPASILKIASMWSGVKKRGQHWPDQDSAYNHGYYYLHKLGIIRARVLDDN